MVVCSQERKKERKGDALDCILCASSVPLSEPSYLFVSVFKHEFNFVFSIDIQVVFDQSYNASHSVRHVVLVLDTGRNIVCSGGGSSCC